MISTLVRIIHLVGSAVPLTILCFMLVLIYEKRKTGDKVIISYCIVALIMFVILLRT